MPELPEVETVMRTVAPATVGRRILRLYASRKPLRGGHPVARARLHARGVGARFRAWHRRGKYLIADLSTGAHLVLHLGMSGRLLLYQRDHPRARHTHLALQLDDGIDLRFEDPRRFGIARCLEADELESFAPLATLGPEPLSRAFSARSLEAALASSRRPIKNALLDQAVVAGIGNIYASEALFGARIDPRRPAGQLQPEELALLVQEAKRTLRQAIRACGTTLYDYRDGWGVQGRYREELRVFDREGERCPRCRQEIRRIVQSGRSTFFCRRCQR